MPIDIVAAHFVQQVVSTYEKYYKELEQSNANEDAEVKGKECSNLIVLLSELYNFQVISCILVYDVIRSLLGNGISEFVVELLLKLVRNAGQQLRTDDPTALKDIIQIVHDKLDGRTNEVRCVIHPNSILCLHSFVARGLGS
jgi:nucleolar MIF4G domain-containing protein 1